MSDKEKKKKGKKAGKGKGKAASSFEKAQGQSPEMKRNTQEITREFCEGKTLIFEPGSIEEALGIQHALMDMGFSWTGGSTDIRDPGECIDHKIVLVAGTMRTKPSATQLKNGLLCDASQFSQEPIIIIDKESGQAIINGDVYEKIGSLSEYDEFLQGVPDGAAVSSVPDDEGEVVSVTPVKEKGGGLTDERVLAEAQAGVDNMVGLSDAKTGLARLTAKARLARLKEEMGLNVNPMALHMVLAGNPGTGKTTFVRNIANLYFALGLIDRPVVVEVKRQDLVGEHIGESEKKTAAQINKARGGILFIDEAYALASDSEQKDFGHRAIETLVAEMENMRDKLVVVVAGYPERMKNFINSNEGLKDRFPTYLTFEDFSQDDLAAIMDQMVEQDACIMTDDARAMAIEMVEAQKQSDPEHFANGRTVRNLVEQVQRIQAERLEQEGVLSRPHDKDDADFRDALMTITAEDVAKVSLAGIEPEKKKVQVGFAAPAKASPAQAAALV